MTSELWNAVDRYVCDQLVPPDPVLEAALAESAAAADIRWRSARVRLPSLPCGGSQPSAR